MNKKKKPKVTIVIPVYNGSKYMKEAIDSALAQMYENIEVIVVNDGSNDKGKTHKIAISYGDKIRYFKKENGGVSTALNLAIKKMTGEYFSWLSHDDVYYPDKIEKQINYLIANNYINKNIILYSDYDLIDNKSRIITKCIKNHKELSEKLEYALLRGNINGLTLLIPKRAFNEFGLFNESLRCTQDYEMWLRMTEMYKFFHMPYILVKSRQHKKQETFTNPKVITEGNPLWINMIKSIPNERMKQLEGSEYAYYKEMGIFLSNSCYKEAKYFCDEMCTKIEKSLKIDINNIMISVIIPFYNRIELTIKSITSVINQTHKNLEIIVINDGSTEKLSKLKEVIKRDHRITLLNNKKNKGVSSARNLGIEASKGDYIAFLDSDDLFKNNKIQEQLFQTLLYGADVSHTSYLKKGIGNPTIVHSALLTGKVIPELIHNCIIATPTVMIKRQILIDERCRFNPFLHIGEDTCFWLQLLRNRNLLGIDRDLTIVNVQKNSAAYDSKKQILGIKSILNFVLNDNEYSQYNYEIALLCSGYIKNVNMIARNEIKTYDSYCPSCSNIINSKSWKLTKPLRMVMKVITSVKEYGLFITLKKIHKQILK